MTYEQWRKEQDKIWMEKQKKSEDPLIKKMTFPYYGAIGGSVSVYTHIDKDGNYRRYAKHATSNTFDLPSQELDSYTKEYLDKIYKDGDEFEISSCSTSIGRIISVKNLTTGEEVDNCDDL
jgi:hypothetical protein